MFFNRYGSNIHKKSEKNKSKVLNNVKFLKILPNKFGSFDLFFMYNANIHKIFLKNKLFEKNFKLNIKKPKRLSFCQFLGFNTMFISQFLNFFQCLIYFFI